MRGKKRPHHSLRASSRAPKKQKKKGIFDLVAYDLIAAIGGLQFNRDRVVVEMPSVVRRGAHLVNGELGGGGGTVVQGGWVCVGA